MLRMVCSFELFVYSSPELSVCTNGVTLDSSQTLSTRQSDLILLVTDI